MVERRGIDGAQNLIPIQLKMMKRFGLGFGLVVLGMRLRSV